MTFPQASVMLNATTNHDIGIAHTSKMSVLTLLSSLGLILLDYVLYRAFSGFPNKNDSSIRQLGGFPLYNAWMFFRKRYDFLWYHFRASPDPYFKFKVLQVSNFLW